MVLLHRGTVLRNVTEVMNVTVDTEEGPVQELRAVMVAKEVTLKVPDQPCESLPVPLENQR